MYLEFIAARTYFRISGSWNRMEVYLKHKHNHSHNIYLKQNTEKNWMFPWNKTLRHFDIKETVNLKLMLLAETHSLGVQNLWKAFGYYFSVLKETAFRNRAVPLSHTWLCSVLILICKCSTWVYLLFYLDWKLLNGKVHLSGT